MAHFSARLTYGFESAADDSTGFGSLPQAGKIAFKNEFKDAVRLDLLNYYEKSSLVAWGAFTLSIPDPSGYMEENAVISTIIQKLTVDSKTGQHPYSVGANVNPGDTLFRGVRYVYIDGERYCEHTYELLHNNAAWPISAQSVFEVVLITLSWKVVS